MFGDFLFINPAITVRFLSPDIQTFVVFSPVKLGSASCCAVTEGPPILKCTMCIGSNGREWEFSCPETRRVARPGRQ